jgi:thermosome
VLGGALLEKAEDLLQKDVHSTIIVDGYRKALTKALQVLGGIAIKIDPAEKQWLVKVAKTSMSSKLVAREAADLADLVVEAVSAVAEKVDTKYKVDIENAKVEKKPGGALSDTKLIRGIVLDKEVVHAGMPKRVEKAKIALVNAPFEIEKTEFDAKINIQNPEQMKQFLEEENRLLKGMTDKVVAVGANVVVCQKGIDDIAQHYLAKAGILAVRRVKQSDIDRLAKATGGRVVTSLEDLGAKDLGAAGLVEERKVEEDKWVFIEGAKNPKAVTLFVRGGTQRIVDEADRSIHDAVMVVKDVLEKPAIVAGGGAPEARVAQELRSWANTLGGREQLAVQKFADAVEAIPITLANNAGMDPIDTQVELRAAQGKGQTWAGVDVFRTKVADMYQQNILEPLAVKEQILKSATEAACMILRIDDVIAASKMKEPSKPPKPGGEDGGAED